MNIKIKKRKMLFLVAIGLAVAIFTIGVVIAQTRMQTQSTGNTSNSVESVGQNTAPETPSTNLNSQPQSTDTKEPVKENTLPETPKTKLNSQAQLSINGIGPVKVGMNIPEATAAARGNRLYVSYAGNDSCYYLKAEGRLKGVSFMVTKDEEKARQQNITSDAIARIDINVPEITTVSGAKIGDTEEKIKSLYPPEQIEVKTHEYNPKGHYLIFVPKEQTDNKYRVVFETDGKEVTSFRAGKLPEVGYVEGCS